MSDPYYPAKSGDPILADTWNNMQIKMRDEIQSHTHRGGADGKQLDGDSILPTASLKVGRVDASVALTVKNIDVLTRLTELGSQKLSLAGGGAITGTLSVSANVAVGATAPGAKRLLVVQPGTPDNNAGLEVRGNGDHSWGVALVLRTVGGVDGASMLLRSRNKSWQVRGESGATATGFQINEDGGDSEYGSGAGTPRLYIKAGGNVGIGTTDPQGALDVRVPGAGGWDRFVVTTTTEWGDTNASYVTVGAGGALGLMIRNPHVTWLASEARASIRYGRSGGIPTGRWWDVGLRTNNAFSFSLENATHTLWLAQDGNIGVGTTAPGARLDVQGGNLRVGGAIVPSVGNSAGSGIMFPTDPGGGSGDAAFIRYYVVSGETTKLLIGCDNDADDSIGFWQTGGERMTIWSANVGIGVTTPQTALHINQRAWSQGIRIQDYSGGGRYFGIHYDNPGVICLYHQNGAGQYMREDGLWNRNSDVALKKNIVDLGGVLDRLVALRPVTFDWKSDGVHTLGLVAQEVEPLFPDIVSESGKRGEDGAALKGIAYESLGVLAVAAIKELKQHYDARIEALERQLQHQESNP